MLTFFARKIIDWHQQNPRELPWSAELEREPYHIWLSEIIMQQTRIEQGKKYYHRFIETYPTVQDLAAAPIDNVMRLWEGLGYYTRARNLHTAANVIAVKLKGVFPATYEELLALPGVGPYSAAAISSFAYNLPHAVVDGNVKRVIARFAGIFESIDDASTHGKISKLAMAYMKGSSPALFNQAIMNFGALVCKPSSPECDLCPLSKKCYAYQHDLVEELPQRTEKKAPSIRFFHLVDIRKGKYTLLYKREQKDIWHSLYTLPFIETNSVRSPGQKKLAALVSSLLNHSHFDVSGTSIYAAEQKLSHQVIRAKFYRVEITGGGKALPGGFIWATEKEIADVGKPKVVGDYLMSRLC